MHFLESSNVGNSYGAFAGKKRRFVPPAFQEEYTAVGDPNGLEPVVPNVAPLLGEDDRPLPYFDFAPPASVSTAPVIIGMTNPDLLLDLSKNYCGEV